MNVPEYIWVIVCACWPIKVAWPVLLHQMESLFGSGCLCGTARLRCEPTISGRMNLLLTGRLNSTHFQPEEDLDYLFARRQSQRNAVCPDSRGSAGGGWAVWLLRGRTSNASLLMRKVKWESSRRVTDTTGGFQLMYLQRKTSVGTGRNWICGSCGDQEFGRPYPFFWKRQLVQVRFLHTGWGGRAGVTNG
jgi:hypothetical protein